MASIGAVFSLLAGTMVYARGHRMIAVTGLLLTGVGMGLFARTPRDGAYPTSVLPAMLTTAVGLGVAFVTLTLAASDGLPDDQAGLASGLANAARQLGGGLGLAALTTVGTAVQSSQAAPSSRPEDRPGIAATLSGYHAAFATAAGVCLIGACTAALLPRRAQAQEAQPTQASPTRRHDPHADMTHRAARPRRRRVPWFGTRG